MAEDWIDLTAASWDGILHPHELALIDATKRLQETTKMASEVQTMIASHSPNTVSANPLKIPAGFVARALIIVRQRLLSGIPDYAIDEDRREQAKAAEAWFLGVARGSIRPQPATDAIANEAAPEKPAGVEIVTSAPSRTGRERMDGI
jgi:hypothetical protein